MNTDNSVVIEARRWVGGGGRGSGGVHGDGGKTLTGKEKSDKCDSVKMFKFYMAKDTI